MALRLVVALGALLLMAACQLPGSSSKCTAQIDWVNFIQVGSTQYVAGPQPPTVLQESDLGPVYAHVKFKVSGNVCDPNYRLKDGDAAFLDVGTPIYQVKGQAPAQQVAARFGGQIVLYKAALRSWRSPALIATFSRDESDLVPAAQRRADAVAINRSELSRCWGAKGLHF